MANSRRRTPCMQNCSAKNEKFEKALSARRLRAAVRSIMSNMDEESLLIPKDLEMFDMNYLGGKDGKHFFEPSEKFRRRPMICWGR